LDINGNNNQQENPTSLKMKVDDTTKLGNNKKRKPDDSFDLFEHLNDLDEIFGKTAKIDPFIKTIKDNDTNKAENNINKPPTIKNKKNIINDDSF